MSIASASRFSCRTPGWHGCRVRGHQYQLVTTFSSQTYPINDHDFNPRSCHSPLVMLHTPLKSSKWSVGSFQRRCGQLKTKAHNVNRTWRGSLEVGSFSMIAFPKGLPVCLSWFVGQTTETHTTSWGSPHRRSSHSPQPCKHAGTLLVLPRSGLGLSILFEGHPAPGLARHSASGDAGNFSRLAHASKPLEGSDKSEAIRVKSLNHNKAKAGC